MCAVYPRKQSPSGVGSLPVSTNPASKSSTESIMGKGGIDCGVPRANENPVPVVELTVVLPELPCEPVVSTVSDLQEINVMAQSVMTMEYFIVRSLCYWQLTSRKITHCGGTTLSHSSRRRALSFVLKTCLLLLTITV